jgi:Lon protease-like protein
MRSWSDYRILPGIPWSVADPESTLVSSTAMSHDSSSFAEFSGLARLFPLPNLVLFPHAIQPLHIFEPRYRQMTQDALDGDRFIAIVLLKPGWEADYEGRPAIHRIACLGRILTEQRLPDGKFNLLLRGVCRLNLDEEVTGDQPYRLARGRPLVDQASEDLPELRNELIEQAKTWMEKHALLVLKVLLTGQLPVGAMCDILSFALPLPIEIKQTLLEELVVEQRIRLLLHHLREMDRSGPTTTPKQGRYPTEFSRN